MTPVSPLRLIDATLSTHPEWLSPELAWEWIEAMSALGVGTVELGTIRTPQQWRLADALLATARRRSPGCRLQFNLQASCGAHPLLARRDVSWRLEVDFEAPPEEVRDVLELARLSAAPTLALPGAAEADPAGLHERIERCRGAGCRAVELVSRGGRPWVAGVEALLHFVQPFDGLEWIWSSQDSGGLALAQALAALQCGVAGVRGRVGGDAEVPLQLLLQRADADEEALAELSDWVFEQFGVEAGHFAPGRLERGDSTSPRAVSSFTPPADVARWLRSRELPSDPVAVERVLARARSSDAPLGELEVVDLLSSS